MGGGNRHNHFVMWEMEISFISEVGKRFQRQGALTNSEGVPSVSNTTQTFEQCQAVPKLGDPKDRLSGVCFRVGMAGLWAAWKGVLWRYFQLPRQARLW